MGATVLAGYAHAQTTGVTRAAHDWLLLASLLTLAPLAAPLPWWVSGSATLLLLAHFARVRRGWPLPPRVLVIGLALIGAALIVRSFGTFIGRDAGTALLVLLLGLKFLELRTRRDARLLALLLCVLLAANLLYADALWVGAFIVVAAIGIVAGLYALTQAETDTSRARFAAILVGLALPLAVVLHLLFPKIEGALWRVPQQGREGITGMSDNMRPGSVAAVSESDAVVMRARFAGAPPPAAQRYWRAVVLTHSDGVAWTRGETRAVTEAFTPLGAPIDYELAIETDDARWLPALDWPARVPNGARALAGMVLEQQSAHPRANFAMRSYPQFHSGALRADVRAQALQLPPLGARTRELAARWRGESEGVIVAKALTFFNRENFYYSLQPPELGANPVEEFLFESRVGFCEHFAGAFVTLMRAAGVPARVVLGYQGGEFNATGGYVVVREYDAHAWAEVWLAGRGWTRVDPTAAVAPERIQYGSAALQRLLARGGIPGRTDGAQLAGLLELDALERVLRDARWLWDATNTGWHRWVADYSGAQQRRFLAGLGLGDWSPTALASVLAALVLTPLALYAWLMRPARTQEPVLAAYTHFTRKLARIGLARAPHEGPRDFAARCAAARPDLRPEVDAISALYVDARYGAGDVDVTALRRRVRAFRPRRLFTDAKTREDAAE